MSPALRLARPARPTVRERGRGDGDDHVRSGAARRRPGRFSRARARHQHPAAPAGDRPWRSAGTALHEETESSSRWPGPGPALPRSTALRVPGAVQGPPVAVTAAPLKALGRWRARGHRRRSEQAEGRREAEDSGTSGLFRFRAHIRRRGARGPAAAPAALAVLAVGGSPQLTTRARARPWGCRFPSSGWRSTSPIPTSRRARASCFAQGWAMAVPCSAAWRAPRGARPTMPSIINATDAATPGRARYGAIQPTGSGGTLTLIYQSPGPEGLLKPDNITVSPRGVASCSAKIGPGQAGLPSRTHSGWRPL